MGAVLRVGVGGRERLMSLRRTSSFSLGAVGSLRVLHMAATWCDSWDKISAIVFLGWVGLYEEARAHCESSLY